MPNKQETIEQRLLGWLETQGYPLEMKVARAFQEADFYVRQSVFFTDPESGDSREIDVSAVHTKDFDKEQGQGCPVHISFFIECKKTKNPWIIFTSEGEDSNPFSYSKHLRTDVAVSETENRYIDLPDNNLFSSPFDSQALEDVGYGITETFTTGKDHAYAAIMGVSKCAMARVQELDRRNKGGKLGYVTAIAFPIVVIDGRLFTARLNQANAISVTEVETGLVVCLPLALRGTNVAVRISTVGHLPVLAQEAMTAANELRVRRVLE